MITLRPQSNTYGAPVGLCTRYKKILTDYTRDEFCMVEDEMAEYHGKWGIMDHENNILIPARYDFIDFFRSESRFKMAIGDLNVQYDDDTMRYEASGAKWGVIDSKEQPIIPAAYDWIEEVEDNVYAVNSGCRLVYNDDFQEDYWFAEGGKWGFLGADGKTIVPLAYDSYYSSWKRVREIIFVQKGTKRFDPNKPYDGFDFKGRQVFRDARGRIPDEYMAK